MYCVLHTTLDSKIAYIRQLLCTDNTFFHSLHIGLAHTLHQSEPSDRDIPLFDTADFCGQNAFWFPALPTFGSRAAYWYNCVCIHICADCPTVGSGHSCIADSGAGSFLFLRLYAHSDDDADDGFAPPDFSMSRHIVFSTHRLFSDLYDTAVLLHWHLFWRNISKPVDESALLVLYCS